MHKWRWLYHFLRPCWSEICPKSSQHQIQTPLSSAAATSAGAPIITPIVDFFSDDKFKKRLGFFCQCLPSLFHNTNTGEFLQ
ncbi:hypothetical protein L1987_22373 [Smallanthus sonchifolius]|uniref:Uncharacterized protein n=1 Tax=Smallanthus sonchifolius TaxID=185202 RepID=A0ACB9IFA0_9ASTR|nr:hypothetical protein L1987_22373 [Smallanthus sonchifolius]